MAEVFTRKDLPPESEVDGDYEVGYGKPPKASQFGKGNKAGKGRPKGAKNVKTIVNALANEKVSIRSGGRVSKMSLGEAALRQLFNKGAAGDIKAIGNIVPLMEKYGPLDEESLPPPAETEAQLDAIIDFLKLSGMLDGEI